MTLTIDRYPGPLTGMLDKGEMAAHSAKRGGTTSEDGGA